MPPPDTVAIEAAGPRGRLLDGPQPAGMMVMEFFTPALPGILADAGLDFAVFDMEASGLSFERFQMLAALSHAAGITPLVRVPAVSTEVIGRCLDLGAAGIMAPKVQNALAAQELTRMTRFPPLGVRGSGLRAYPSGYVDATSANDRASAPAVTVCQLETMEAVEQAERIVAIPGVDVLNVGANDLAAQIGVNTGHADVVAAIERVRELSAAHGKAYLGRPVHFATATHQNEHRMVLLDHDTAALSAHTRAGVRALRKGPR